MADVQGRATAANLRDTVENPAPRGVFIPFGGPQAHGDSQGALANYQRAERLRRPAVAARPATEPAHLELAEVLTERDPIHACARDRVQATSCYHHALEAAGTLERSRPASSKACQRLAALLMAMSDWQHPAGDVRSRCSRTSRKDPGGAGGRRTGQLRERRNER